MKKQRFDQHEFTELFSQATNRSLNFAFECLSKPLPQKTEFYLSSINRQIDWDRDSKNIRLPQETIISLDKTISYLLNKKGWFREGIRLSVFGVINYCTVIEVIWEGEEWTNIVPGKKPYFKDTPFIVEGPPIDTYNRDTKTDDIVDIVYYPLCQVIKVVSPSFWVLEKKDVTELLHSDTRRRYNEAFSLCRKVYSGFIVNTELQKLIVELAKQETNDEIKLVYVDILARFELEETIPLLLQWTNEPNSQVRQSAYLGLSNDKSDEIFHFLLNRVSEETDLEVRWGILRALRLLSKRKLEREKRVKERIKGIKLTRAEKRSLKSFI
jgi:hypothetical protein